MDENLQIVKQNLEQVIFTVTKIKTFQIIWNGLVHFYLLFCLLVTRIELKTLTKGNMKSNKF